MHVLLEESVTDHSSAVERAARQRRRRRGDPSGIYKSFFGLNDDKTSLEPPKEGKKRVLSVCGRRLNQCSDKARFTSLCFLGRLSYHGSSPWLSDSVDSGESAVLPCSHFECPERPKISRLERSTVPIRASTQSSQSLSLSSRVVINTQR